MLRPKQKAFTLGALKLTIVGPGKKELDDLRAGWKNWLDANEGQVTKIRAQMKKKIDEFSANALDGSPFDLHEWNGIPAYKNVTTPNVASLMLMVEEDGKRILLTGDAQQNYVVTGLEKTGFLATNAGMHLDVLKVQHHGSENNVDTEFCRRVSADHYVFCGNGTSGNPEPEVVKLVFDSRLGAPAKRTLAPQAQDKKFTFWFSTTSKSLKPGSDEKTNFDELTKELAKLQKASKGKLKLRFNHGAFTTLSL
jgi:hypothetical protein